MNSLILRTAARLLVSLMILFSLFMLLRGHNSPGGGFVGGLIAVTGFALYSLAQGPQAVRQAVRIDPSLIAVTGLGLGIGAGLFALLCGSPFLTVLWTEIPLGDEPIAIGTALFFDLGVYLVVLGSVLSLILALEEEQVS